MTLHVRTDPACAAFAGTTPLAARGVSCPVCVPPPPVHYSRHAGWCPVASVFDADPIGDCGCGALDEAIDRAAAIVAAQAEAIDAGALDRAASVFADIGRPIPAFSRGRMVRQPRELPFSTPGQTRFDPDRPESDPSGGI